MDEPNLVRLVPGRDPARLRSLLSAHFAHERACVLRGLLVHLLALVSALVWIVAVWPARVGVAATHTVLATWAILAVTAAVAAVAEAVWRARSRALRDGADVESPAR